MTMEAVIAITILASYVIMTCLIYGIPKSLSQSWFSIAHRWIFSVVMIVVSGLLFLTFMDLLPVKWQWIGFLCSAGGMMIGFSPNLDDEMEHSAHMIGAALLGMASQALVFMLCPLALSLWAFALPAIFLFSECKVFWIEMCAGALLCCSIFLQL